MKGKKFGLLAGAIGLLVTGIAIGVAGAFALFGDNDAEEIYFEEINGDDGEDEVVKKCTCGGDCACCADDVSDDDDSDDVPAEEEKA